MMPPGFWKSGFRAALACIWEATARKVGNVHRYADFGDTSYLDFITSALAIQSAIDDTTRPTIHAAFPPAITLYQAISDTQFLVRKNTNLGIVLLLHPLASVPGTRVHTNPPTSDVYDLRAGIPAVLARYTAKDAAFVYAAIRLAHPGGLGDASEQDVREEPTVTLVEAMKLAADRDMVARQYANDFADVFDFGVPALLRGIEQFECIEAAIIDSQFQWLAAYPDSLIARKNGPEVAADVQRRAAEVLRLGGIATPEGRRAGVEFDQHLRSASNALNPGTTADLITACLFVVLRENKVSLSAPFRWHVSDWL